MKGASMAALALVPLAVAVLLISSLPSSSAASPVQWGKLDPHFYDHSCPQAQQIVASIVGKAHYQDPRMAASLLRLHFHDCFVKVRAVASITCLMNIPSAAARRPVRGRA
jgi:peroxidase